tara:strand:+ start:176 stop:970 length:795 start_codon:yes stop_codon:yes gene_type:complete
MYRQIIIIIPHYNNPKGLEMSILSINEKIKADIIIIDDGSFKKPNIQKLKKTYKLGSIVYKKMNTNKGIAETLNIGLDYAKTKKYQYIARLDAGDTFFKNKLTKQYKYLKENKDVKLLGTWARIIDSKGRFLYNLKHPITHKEIKKVMHLNSAFVHPSVMFSSDILTKVKSYPLQYLAAEDYAFFFNIINEYKAENYPEILIDYVVDENSISTTKRNIQVKNRIKIMVKNFYFGAYPIYGIIRSCILLLFSRNLLNKFKSKTYN